MHKKIILLFSLISILAFSCEKPLVACIELSGTTIGVGDEIDFKSCSQNALSLAWSFEGPEGSPENNAASSDIEFSQSFSLAGTYKVRLHAYRKFSFAGEVAITETEIVIY